MDIELPVSCLYILEINPLSVALFANTFSYYIDCLFCFVDGFPYYAKALSLIRSYLFSFAFIFLPWETDIKILL